MRIREDKIDRYIIWLLAISALLRGFFAAFLEFGNDEVYYWTYAKYPDLSHFDHPGMLGWIMQIFSLNLLFDSEFALRLSSVVFMTINTYLIYRMGCLIKNKLTGFYAAILFTASLYCFIIAGIFILPDTPLSLFMILSLFFFLKMFINREQNGGVNTGKDNVSLILGGLFAGFAMLSKYSAVFVWSGVGLYILFYDRKLLKNKYLYLSVLISALCLLPLLIWNIQNDFISFSFHGDRVGLFGKLHLEYFFVEIVGEIAYNNPVNYVLIIIALVALLKGKEYISRTPKRLLLSFALPFVLLFWIFALTRSILPHWTSPAITMLVLFPAAYLAERQEDNGRELRLPKSLVASVSLLLLVLVLGTLEIKTGFIPMRFSEKSRTVSRWNETDVTMTMYGWRKIKPQFEDIRNEKIEAGLMKEEDGMIALKWFPLANLDYYVAYPLGINMYGLGDINKIHKYQWINEERGGIQKGADYWFLSESSDYYAPEIYLKNSFEEIIPCDTIVVDRCGSVGKYVFVYMCKGKK
ncbi:MAG: ArnT family glycosyltransferase [Candidatus Limimorpha sp.]